jgi:hypothetical protein
MRLATVVLLLTLCDVLPTGGADYSVLLLTPLLWQLRTSANPGSVFRRSTSLACPNEDHASKSLVKGPLVIVEPTCSL